MRRWLEKCIVRLKDGDPVSDTLQAVGVRDVSLSRLEVGGDWSFRFPAKPHLKFHTVLKGDCWMTMAGQAPCRLRAGDTFLLSSSPTFVLARDPDRVPEEAARVFGTGLSLYSHGGDDTVILGGGLETGPEHASLRLGALPPFVVAHSDTSLAKVLDATLRLLDHELAEEGLGSTSMVRRLADVLIIQALRLVAGREPPEGPGWVAALGDRRIGPTLAAMHGDTSRRWTVGELARAAGMSRASFASRFTELTGMAPITYLQWLRMRRAREDLRRRDEGLATLAVRYGYASPGSFSNAFRRTFGVSPGRISRLHPWQETCLPAGHPASRSRSPRPPG